VVSTGRALGRPLGRALGFGGRSGYKRLVAPAGQTKRDMEDALPNLADHEDMLSELPAVTDGDREMNEPVAALSLAVASAVPDSRQPPPVGGAANEAAEQAASAPAAAAAAASVVAAEATMSVPPGAATGPVVWAAQVLTAEKEKEVVTRFCDHPAMKALPEKQRFRGRTAKDLQSIRSRWFLGENGSAQYDPTSVKSRETEAREKSQKFFYALATVADWDKISTKYKVGTGVLLEMRRKQDGIGGGGRAIEIGKQLGPDHR
jgi:hypothetical protein